MDIQLLKSVKIGGDGPVNGYESAPICLDVFIEEERVHLMATYNPEVVEEKPLERLCEDYNAIMGRLLEQREVGLGEVVLDGDRR
jgi:hypothetical protein